MGNPEKIDTKDFRSLLFSWLFSQGVSTVMLAAILIAMAYGGNYAMTTGIPAHLKQIQDGYREQGAANKEALREQQASFEKSLKQVTDMCEKEMQFMRDRDRK